MRPADRPAGRREAVRGGVSREHAPLGRQRSLDHDRRLGEQESLEGCLGDDWDAV